MNYAVILSGGTGSRTGLDIPKQYYKVNGKPIIQYVIEKIEKCDFIDGYVIVATEEWQQFICDAMKGESDVDSRFFGFALPGENRQLSIYNGLVKLEGCAKADDHIIIQDAARPNTSIDLYKRILSFSDEYDGAMPVLPMKDTVYLSRDGKQIDELLNRSEIFAGQAPEVFVYEKYRKANENLLPDKILQMNGSSEPAFLAGMKIALVDGEETNYKITTPQDVIKFEKQMSGE